MARHVQVESVFPKKTAKREMPKRTDLRKILIIGSGGVGHDGVMS
jgi:hypothetical protein